MRELDWVKISECEWRCSYGSDCYAVIDKMDNDLYEVRVKRGNAVMRLPSDVRDDDCYMPTLEAAKDRADGFANTLMVSIPLPLPG